MVEVGRLLAGRSCIVVTGGFGGVGMEAPAKGAREAGGTAIGYTTFGFEGNGFLTQQVDCRQLYVDVSHKVGVGDEEPHLEPPPEVQSGIRRAMLLSADGFIVAAGGGPGTMVELMAIINNNHRIWRDKPKYVAILKPVGVDCEGWDISMLRKLTEWGVLPGEGGGFILVVDTPEKAVGWVTS